MELINIKDITRDFDEPIDIDRVFERAENAYYENYDRLTLLEIKENEIREKDKGKDK